MAQYQKEITAVWSLKTSWETPYPLSDFRFLALALALALDYSIRLELPWKHASATPGLQFRPQVTHLHVAYLHTT